MNTHPKDTLPTIHVAAGIIWRDNAILIAKRPKTEPRSGFWEFPGGKQEKGEAIDETLTRELFEELGIQSTCIVPFTTLEHAYSDLYVCLHLMHVIKFLGTPQPLLRQELRWAKLHELDRYNFLPADRCILSQIRYPD